LIAALGRGGIFKLFRNGSLVVSDTGPTLKVKHKDRVAVTHLKDSGSINFSDDEITVKGRFAWAKTARLTPIKNVMLRLLMLSLGRFSPNLVRRLLQYLLVTGRAEAPFRYVRVFRPIVGGWSVRDEITPDRGWSQVSEAGIGGFQTSMTTVMARVFQLEQLHPWIDLSNQLTDLGEGKPLSIERQFGSESCDA
jgi:hypothetical protein